MSILRVLVGFGGKFHGLPGKLMRGQMFFLIVMSRSHAVGVRRQIVELSSSLVPIVSAYPATVAAIASIAHGLLLFLK